MQGIFEFKGEKKNKILAIVVHGSIQTHFQQSHKLVQILIKNVETVVSIELIGHGTLASENIKKNDFLEYFPKQVNYVLETFKDRCSKFYYFGFSLGGFLGIKINVKVIINYCFIGMGLRLKPEKVPMVSNFFTEASAQKHGLIDSLEKNHGSSWPKLMIALKGLLTNESGLMATESEINKIKKSNAIFILAKYDQTNESSDISFAGIGKNRIFEVPGDHFTYFNSKVAWNPVSKIVLNFINP